MTQAQISMASPGVLHLTGSVNHYTGPDLLVQGRQLIGQCSESNIVVDCSAVERSDSVAMALLLAFIRTAHGFSKTLEVRGITEEMEHIVDVCGLEDLFPRTTGRGQRL